MFGSSGAIDLGYASNALMIALIRALVKNGTLTEDQASNVLDDAVSTLGPAGHIDSIGKAIRMIQTDVRAQIAA